MPEGCCFRSGYCNKLHRLEDGIPISHKCRILNPEFLRAEKARDLETMLTVFERWESITLHDGKPDGPCADCPYAKDDDGTPPDFSHFLK
jgi:hypothetical protein